MPKVLTRLKIREVSSVDRGAGEGVKIMLMKRNEDKDMSVFAKLFKGFGGSASKDIDKSVEGLAESVASILADNGDDVEKGDALSKTFEQFSDHLKSTLTAGPAVAKQGASDMDISVLRKAFGLADTATEADVTAAIAKSQEVGTSSAKAIAKLNNELEIIKAGLTEAEVEYLKKESLYDEEEEEKPELSEGKKGKKKAFLEASHEERAKIMKVAEPEMPAYIKKVLDKVEQLEKQNAELVAKVAAVDFAKQAQDIGLTATHAETIRKAYSGDKAAVDDLIGIIKRANAAAAAGEVFKEFGSSQGTGVSDDPIVELTQKADALRKSNPNLSQSQAFAKVYEDPANSELVAKERAKNRPSAA